MISPQAIEQIIETADVVEVINEFVTLKKRGANHIGLCPFHNEKTPSFTVSAAKGIYKCFGCGAAGNPVKFLMEHEHFSYPEALRWLAAKYNIILEEEAPAEEVKEAHKLQDSLYIINSFAQNFYAHNLFNTEEGKTIGLSYFKERGFSEKIIKEFQLGYALNEWDSFTKHALEKGHRTEMLQKANLTSAKGGRQMDFFRGRVMFPIHNLSGKVVGFGGRILGKQEKAPKYINSPESDIYTKSKVLYGAYFAKNAIRQANECLLVEGYTDVISLFQAGIKNVVASSGTSLTQEQIRLIKRFTKNIILVFDGDGAGLKAALRGVELILEEGLNVKVAILAGGDDPDSFVQKEGASGFTDYIRKQAKDYILFKAHQFSEEEKNDPAKKAGFVTEIAETIGKLPEPVKREIYVKECSTLLDISEQMLFREINKKARKNLQNNTTVTQQESEQAEALNTPDAAHTENNLSVGSDEEQEKDVIRLLLEYGDQQVNDTSVAKFILTEISDIQIGKEIYQKIINEYENALKEDKTLKQSCFTNHPDPEISALAVSILSEPYEISGNWKTMHQIYVPEKKDKLLQDVHSAIYRLKLRQVLKRLKEVNQKIREAENEKEIEGLLKIYQQFTAIKQEVSNLLGSTILK